MAGDPCREDVQARLRLLHGAGVGHRKGPGVVMPVPRHPSLLSTPLPMSGFRELSAVGHLLQGMEFVTLTPSPANTDSSPWFFRHIYLKTL